MEMECMRACMRKLTIWYTPNFKPIISHDELDHIMSAFGFIPLLSTTTTTTAIATAAAAVWKEYSFPAAGTFLSKFPNPPLPRLPYPRIDGLHVNTYRSFLESVNFYLRMNNISDIFHIRGVPLHHAHDRSQKWLRMVRDDVVYVYREGTMESASCNKERRFREGTMKMRAACKNANKDQDSALVIVPWKNIMDRVI